MESTFDPARNAANIDKHGISLTDAAKLDWDSALVWSDDRTDSGELRQVALGLIGDRVHAMVFAERDDVMRILSLRKANSREVKYFDEQT
ncbi:MAG: hypothetical protein JWQ21_429 [Herminiimonas sp.]|jgi:uncharacterized DUF497 family protein|nr:hypothetical protein [Herminiimonas sp.]